MLNAVRDFVTSHNDAAGAVRQAKRFSIQLPLIGKVAVPPPNHLAFYGVLTVLGVTELIPWPVAVGLGVGHALTVCRGESSEAPAASTAPGARATASTPADAAQESEDRSEDLVTH